MAVADTILKLFGWKSQSAPMPKHSKELPGGEEGFVVNPFEGYHNSVKPPYERRYAYDVYDDMDEMDIIASVLDAYAEDATQWDREHRATVWVDSKSEKVKKVCEELFDRLKLEEYSEGITRDVAKYGDDFAHLTFDEKTKLITGWDWKDPRDTERVETVDGVLLGFEETAKLGAVMTSLDRGEKVNLTYKPWEIIHFRRYIKKRVVKQKFRNIYGTSTLSGSEKIAKQVKIDSDMLMVHRLTKSLDKRMYRIDVGNAAVEEEIAILKRWKRALKSRAYIDPAAGRFDKPFDPFTWNEDIFWAARKDSDSTVENIPGQGNVSDIVDVEFMVDRLFGSLRAPKAYFGFEGDVNAKATLSSQDLKWGRVVNSVQKSVRQGLTRLCQIQLAYLGIDPYEVFTVQMVVPSVLEELSRLEAYQTVIDSAERMMSLGETLGLDQDAWRYHVMHAVLGFSEEEIEKYSGPPEDTDDQEPKDPDDSDPEKERDASQLDEDIKLAILDKIRNSSSYSSDPYNARKSELPGGKGEAGDMKVLPIPSPTKPTERTDESSDSSDDS